MILLYGSNDIFSSADDRHALDQSSPFVGIVINHTARFQLDLLCIFQFFEDHLACCSGSDHHDVTLLVVCHLLAVFPHKIDISVCKPDTGRQDDLRHCSDHVVGHRHTPAEYRHSGDVKQKCDHIGYQDVVQLAEAGEAPQAVVQLQHVKDDQTEYGVEWCEFKKRGEVFFWDRAVV